MTGPEAEAPAVAPAAPPERPGAWARFGPVLGILALVLFAYGNSLHGEFAFDDRYEIRENPAIRDLSAFLGPAGYRAYPNRFVAYLTFALNHRLGGYDPFGWHVANLLVHLAASLLVYRLARLAFRAPLVRDSALAPASRGVAFVAGALFATHPLGTQAVTYVVQRLTSLAALLYLLAAVLYLAWRLADPDRRLRRGLLYAGVLLSSLLAVKTKEIAFTLPAALALLEWVLFPRGGARRWLPIAPVAAIALLIPLNWFEARGGGGGSLAQAIDAAERATRLQTTLPRMDYLRTQAAVVCEYLRLLAWPTGQNLDHDFPVYRSWLAPRVLLSLAVLGALAGVALWALRGTRPGGSGRPARLDPAWRLVALGIGWFFLALAVESSVIPIVDVIYEHRAYLPSAGMFLAVAALLGLAFQALAPASVARLLALTGAALGLLLGSLTLQRNAVWATPLTLWTDVVSKSPGKERPHQNLGETLDALGRLTEAEREFRAAIAVDPGSAAARNSLAIVLQKSGRAGEAEAEYREVLRLDPRRHAAMFNLADLLWRQGRRDEAVELYRRFLDVAPARDTGPRSLAEARVRAASGR